MLIFHPFKHQSNIERSALNCQLLVINYLTPAPHLPTKQQPTPLRYLWNILYIGTTHQNDWFSTLQTFDQRWLASWMTTWPTPRPTPVNCAMPERRHFFEVKVFSEVSNGSQLRTSGGIDPMKKQELKDSTEYWVLLVLSVACDARLHCFHIRLPWIRAAFDGKGRRKRIW